LRPGIEKEINRISDRQESLNLELAEKLEAIEKLRHKGADFLDCPEQLHHLIY
jgi:hypothetical protein